MPRPLPGQPGGSYGPVLALFVPAVLKLACWLSFLPVAIIALWLCAFMVLKLQDYMFGEITHLISYILASCSHLFLVPFFLFLVSLVASILAICLLCFFLSYWPSCNDLASFLAFLVTCWLSICYFPFVCFITLFF